jgi:hypothetical protein
VILGCPFFLDAAFFAGAFFLGATFFVGDFFLGAAFFAGGLRLVAGAFLPGDVLRFGLAGALRLGDLRLVTLTGDVRRLRLRGERGDLNFKAEAWVPITLRISEKIS